MSTPASKAAHLVDRIERECLPEAWAELDIDPSADPLVVYFVSVMYHSPARPFAEVRTGVRALALATREWGEAKDTVMAALRRGDEPAAVARQLRRLQRWEWGAIALDADALAAELARRYALSAAAPETEVGRHRIPGGLVITCEVLLRGTEY